MIEQIKICNEIFHIKRLARRTRCAVLVGDDGEFLLHVPAYMSDKEIKINAERFIPDFIENLLNDRVKTIAKLHSYNDGDEFFCCGEKVKLKIEDSAREIKRDGQFLISPRISSREEANVLFYNFYAHLLYELLQQRLSYWCKKTHLSPNAISIKDVKSRWGSCSSNKNITFNVKMALLPQYLFDYVIVHELCHLKEMNHSPRFWQLVKKFIPEAEEYRKELKCNEEKYTW